MDGLDLKILAKGFAQSGWDADESVRLARLVVLFLELPNPPDPDGSFPEYGRFRELLAAAVDGGDADEIEERFLELYAHLHMNQAPYSDDERSRMDAVGGYWNHAGGLSPILKAEPWISPDTVSADFGAGNGLQGLLLQVLVPSDRVEWIVGNVIDVPATGYDFIYLYRPVRPEGPGRDFFTRFAHEVESEDRPPIIFSIADCLRDFLSDRYEVFYGDGHLTCFRPRKAGKHS